MLNKHRITCYPTALPHPRSLPVSPLRVRLQRVARGASTSITCANGIVNTPPIEVLLVVRRLTHRRRSESQRIKLVFALYFLRVVIGRHCLATTRVVYAGGSLFGCCCWSGAAVGLYWLMIYLTCTGEDVLHFALQLVERPTRVVHRPTAKSCLQTCSFMLFFGLSCCLYVIRSLWRPLFTFSTSQASHLSAPPHHQVLRQPLMCQQTLQPVPKQQTVTA